MNTQSSSPEKPLESVDAHAHCPSNKGYDDDDDDDDDDVDSWVL